MAFVFAILAVGCITNQDPSPIQSPGKLQDIVDSMKFRRHPRAPKLCLGYTYVTEGFGSSATGGPAMVAFDCDLVPSEMIVEP